MLIDFQLARGSQQIAVESGERLLHSSLAQGVSLPYECASGTCGACRASLLSGSIDNLWPEAPGAKNLGPRDFLLCQCTPQSDCTVKVESATLPIIHVPRYGSATLQNVQRLTSDIVKFTLALDTELHYCAGQFVGIEVPGVRGFRSYSMVNYDAGTRRLDFVMKRLLGGGFSEWLSRCADRTQVRWFGPLGSAVFDPDRDEHLVCIAGGTGIAGMMAILTHASGAEYFYRNPGDVFFGVRTFGDAFFLAELNEFATQHRTSLNIVVAFSDPSSGIPSSELFPALRFEHGFVHEVAARHIIGKCSNVGAYIAGPTVAVNAAIKMLILQAKVSPHSIRYDRFA